MKLKMRRIRYFCSWWLFHDQWGPFQGQLTSLLVLFKGLDVILLSLGTYLRRRRGFPRTRRTPGRSATRCWSRGSRSSSIYPILPGSFLISGLPGNLLVYGFLSNNSNMSPDSIKWHMILWTVQTGTSTVSGKVLIGHG